MSGNRVKGLLKSWEAFDLHGFSEELDVIAGEITERVDTSEASKTCLISEYGEWINSPEAGDKKNTPGLSSLIASFQSKIDELTQRSTQAEKGFLKIYSKIIIDLKDPVPVLTEIRDSILTRLSKFEDLEIEVSQLRETLKDYNAEISKSRANDKKLAELKTKLEAYDRNIDATLQERIGEVTTQFAEESESKVKEVKFENDILEARLTEWETKNRDLQTKYDLVQTELFDLKRGKEEKTDAIGSELDILYNDLDSAQSRYNIIEKENENLKEEILDLKKRLEVEVSFSPVKGDSNNFISFREFEAKTGEIQRLLNDNGQLKRQAHSFQEYYEEKLLENGNKKIELEEQILRLNNQLGQISDYASIKKELNVFKAHEFGEDHMDKPLDTLLLSKSKVLQSKNSLLRLDNEKLRSEGVNLSEKISSLSSDNERQKNLINELERHVASLQGMSRDRGEAEGRSSTDILNDALNDEPSEIEQLKTCDSSSSLLPIIKAQRERFRLRNEELEELMSRQSQQMTLLQSEMSDLRSDNVKLYEKIRFLQSAGSGSGKTSSGGNDVESRYAPQYEQHINPFTTFNRRERTRQIENLNIAERIILSMVRFMMSNKTARLFVFIYSIILHGLVFAVLMKMVYHDAELRGRAAEWHDKYSQHMIQVHNSDHVG